MRLLFSSLVVLSLIINTVYSFQSQFVSYHLKNAHRAGSAARGQNLHMVMDDFLMTKLDSIKRTYDGLTERLADPDLLDDRKTMLIVTRERAGMESTVEAYDSYRSMLQEYNELTEMFEDDSTDDEMREMCRSEIKELEVKQDELEEAITVMLLPSDPNDDRNVMLEVRAGTMNPISISISLSVCIYIYIYMCICMYSLCFILYTH